MRVLWFEISVTPAGYDAGKTGKGGWQDALENLLVKDGSVELIIAFYSEKCSEIRSRDYGGCTVSYIPVNVKFSLIQRIEKSFSWNPMIKECINAAQRIVQDVNPDIIHVFGTEWPWGLLASRVNKPVVVHVQGAVIPYSVARFSPGYSMLSVMLGCFPSIRTMLHVLKDGIVYRSWMRCEEMVWKSVEYYMGRTKWDRALVEVCHPNAKYFSVNEALRPVFLAPRRRWSYQDRGKIRLLSTGCSSFRKGPEVILRTASILKKMGLDVEWNIVGGLPKYIRKSIERGEHLSFDDNNINFLGFKSAEEIVDLVCESTIYVHAAHMENSPNSICEAQIVGIPIVSTNVGGIESLLGDSGVLVPDDDSWMLAREIVLLASDTDRMNSMSERGREMATKRHAPDLIIEQLLSCYSSVIELQDNK